MRRQKAKVSCGVGASAMRRCFWLPPLVARLTASLLTFAFCLAAPPPAFCLLAAGGQSLASRADATGERARLAAEASRRGEALRRQWNLAAAEAAFREALALDPASFDARLGLSRIARARF